MIPPSTTVSRSDRALYRDLAEGEGGVVLHLDTGAYHGVDEVGAAVWKMLDGATFAEVLALLRTELDGVPPTFDDEIGDFLEELAARALVVLGPAGDDN
jgi:hypothetical protein